jgi:hypothetical protein
MSDRIFISSMQKELAKGTPGGAPCFQTEMRQLSDISDIGSLEHMGTGCEGSHVLWWNRGMQQ